jgi:predicted GNAT family N-acyltransferase
MSELEVVLISTAADMAEPLSVRRRVFIEEQGVPESLEIDEFDAEPALGTTALHVLLRVDGVVVATGRLLLDAGERHAHIGRVAVLAGRRGRGYGRAVMLALHELARDHGIDALTLAAQLHAIGFYEKLGYVARDDIFLDAGIEHRYMDLSILRGPAVSGAAPE